MKTKRTHDKFYLDDDRYDKVKESFKFIFEHSFEEDELKQKIEVCDLGCATGEFLYFLKTKAPLANLSGLDIMGELVQKAQKYVPDGNFKIGSVLDRKNYFENQFHKTYLTGVHSIFDEFETFLNNLIYWSKAGGSIFVSGMFNPYPIDVLIKSRDSKDYSSSIYEEGWNIHSIKSISNFLDNIKEVQSYEFKKFEIKIDLPKQDDIRRGWTFTDSDNNRIITNGLSIIQNQYTLKIQL